MSRLDRKNVGHEDLSQSPLPSTYIPSIRLNNCLQFGDVPNFNDSSIIYV
ncbi:hypothetical protein [Lysinibacillus sphaericus]|nr:hypothetical protein [Lysinibacillus sphaericus]